MRRPNSLLKYQILRGSQELARHYFSIGFHYFYTQFYTQPNPDSMSRFEGKGRGIEPAFDCKTGRPPTPIQRGYQ